MTNHLGPHYFFDKMGKRFQKKEFRLAGEFLPVQLGSSHENSGRNREQHYLYTKKKGCDLP